MMLGRAVSPTRHAHARSTFPTGYTPVEVPLTLDFAGGVTPASILDPQIGVLLRLGISCFVPVPLSDVHITSIALRDNAAAPRGPESPVAVADPVNTATGKCVDIRAARALSGADTLFSRALTGGDPPILEVGVAMFTCVVVGAGRSDGRHRCCGVKSCWSPVADSQHLRCRRRRWGRRHASRSFAQILNTSGALSFVEPPLRNLRDPL